MKPLFAVATLFLLLTPVLAQQAGQPASESVQQSTEAKAQPNAAQSGVSQAAALAAAQEAEEQSAQDAEDQQQSDPQSDAPATADQQQNSPQPYRAEENTEQQSAADQSYEQPGGQPLPERRTLHVAPAPAVLPRSEASAYPVYRVQAQLSVGAKLLSAKEVEQKFNTPLGKRFVVVEVGVFPAGEVTLRPQDFTLRIGNDAQAFFPSTPEEVATDLAVAGRSRRVAVFPTLGVGYSNGPWGRGVSTGVGVGVAGGPRPYPRNQMGANRRVVENELRDKSLPVGNMSQAVAGYLYFREGEARRALQP